MNISLITQDPETVWVFKSRPHLYQVTIHDRIPGDIKEILKDDPQVIFIDFFQKDEDCAAFCHQLKCDLGSRLIPVVLISEKADIDSFAASLNCAGVLRKDVDRFQYLSAISHCLEQQLTK